MKCERCHKERDEYDFRQVYHIGRFCSFCADNLELLVKDQGEAAAKAWVYMPRNDLIAHIEKPNATVLDCGCWAGYTMEALRNLGHTVYGLDIEDNRTVAKDLPFYRCDLEAMVMLELPRIGHVFHDYILFGDVLEHLADPFPALDFAKQILVPAGRIIISVPNMGWIGAILQLANQERIRDESGHFDRTHLRYYTLPTLIDTVKEAGLKPLYYQHRELPEVTPFPEGQEKVAFQWANLVVECDRAQYDLLNTYQIILVAEAA